VPPLRRICHQCNLEKVLFSTPPSPPKKERFEMKASLKRAHSLFQTVADECLYSSSSVTSPAHTDHSSPGVPFAPRSMVGDALHEHTLVVSMGVDALEVYRALMGLSEWRQSGMSSMAVPYEGRRLHPSRIPLGACVACGHRVELDSRGGDFVCAQCGLVQQRGSVNVNPEYVESDPRVAPQGCPSIPRVSKPVYLSVHGEEGRRIAWSELEHWNHYTHWGGDTLKTMKTTLDRWTPSGLTKEVRICAVLLETFLPEIIPREDDTRKRLLTNRLPLREQKPGVEVVARADPNVHDCLGCGKRFSCARDARFHCRKQGWGIKRRRQGL